MFIQIQSAYIQLEAIHSPIASKSQTPDVTVAQAVNKEPPNPVDEQPIIDFGRIKTNCSNFI